jgi:cytochrome c peroxidase
MAGPVARLKRYAQTAVLVGCLAWAAPKQSVTIAAAANLTEVCGLLGTQFESATGIHPVFSFGSTAQLTQQIENGAPFDLFLAADSEHPKKLDDEGMLAKGTRAVYATGVLALWVPPASRAKINGLEDLAGSDVRVIAIARPELAPYGAATVETLTKLGLWERVKSKVVYGDNISMAKQYGTSGNADAVFTAWSLVLTESGKLIQVDEKLHAPITQELGVVARSTNQAAARSFATFVTSGKGREILSTHGYRVGAAKAWMWDLPKGFPAPKIPASNPMTAEKVELGLYLFYDKRLSVNGTQACASCHKQELAFTDGKPVGIGATGEHHPRGPMSLVNVAYSATLTWNNPDLKSLEEQALTPMFGDHPIELGLHRGIFPAALRSDAKYRLLFAQAFPDEADPYTIDNLTRALACFERTIISARSPYDRYHYGGDDSAVSDAAKRGEILFFSQPYTCFTCHGGYNFSGSGLHKTDAGMFKAPTLRNIALTAPYMHDGSLATLDDVLIHHAKDSTKLTESAKKDFVAFLQSLTDEAVLTDPRFADPRK